MASELARTLGASEEDRLLQAESLVRSYCGWHIAPVRPVVWTVEVGVSQLVVLPTFALRSIESMTDQLGREVPTTSYRHTPSGVVRFLPAAWGEPVEHFEGIPWGLRGAFTLHATHGYDEPPAEVTGVVQAVAQRALDNPGSLLREQVGPFSNTYSQTGLQQTVALTLMPDERRVLAPFKLPARA